MSKDERLRAALQTLFDEMEDADFIAFYNDIARDDGYDMIYHMYELDEICSGYTLTDFLQDMINFSIDDEYFTIRSNGDITSFDSILDSRCPADRDEMIQYIINTGYGFGNDAVEELLDSFAYSVD